MKNRFHSFFLIVLFVILADRTAMGADLPVSCSQGTIQRSAIHSSVELSPGLPIEIRLDRKVSVSRIQAADGTRGLKLVESGSIALQANALGVAVQQVANAFRARSGSMCEISISTWKASSQSKIPPPFEVYGDGRGWKCTSFDYQCGQEFKCEVRWGYQKCQTWQKFCRASQKFHIGNWWMRARGHLDIGLSNNGTMIGLVAVRDSFTHDVTGAGEIGGILERWGLFDLLRNLDGGFKVEVDPNKFPSLAKLVSLLPPGDFVASPLLNSAGWAAIGNTESGKFDSVGISYLQTVQLKMPTACRVIDCMRHAESDEKYTRCVLGN